jgi:outer membrane lipoprotein-sorting protein
MDAVSRWPLANHGTPILWLLLCAPALAADNSGLVTAWLAAQTNVHTWSADFVQTRQLKSLVQPLTTPGKVWFAAPDRFRWELGNPAQTIALRQTNLVLVIYPKLKRVEQFDLAAPGAGTWREALTLLEAGFPRTQADLDARFKLLSVAVAHGIMQISLETKSLSTKRLIPKLGIGFSTNDLSLAYTELRLADGSTLRNEFTNAVINPVWPSDPFQVSIEADYQVVEPLARPGRAKR